MRILILGQFFDPEPTLKGLAFAKMLSARGHEVEVLTGFPNYPGGNVYPGYRIRPWRKEVIDGIKVVRVALYPSHDRSGIHRLLNYFSFALSASLFGPFLVKKPDVLYVYHPPLTVSLPAAVLKISKRCPIVYDIQDLWPDTLGATGMVRSGHAINLVGRWAKSVYGFVNRIVVLSPGFKEKLTERGVPAQKIRTIYNWNEEVRQPKSVPDTGFEQKWLLADRFNVIYAGSLGSAQALDSVLDAAAICRTNCPRAQFILIGRGTEEVRLKLRATNEGLSNVTFIPNQPMEVMAGVFPLADALLVSSKNDPLFTITIPSKTQAYLAAGRPIIIAAEGNAPDLVQKAQAGIVVPPEDPERLADAVARMAGLSTQECARLGSNGRAFYEEELSMSRGVDQFEEEFRDVALTQANRQSIYRNYGKRLLDLVIVVPALLVLLPLLLLISLASAYQFGWPIVFRQYRAGKNGKVFSIYKFRTMFDECDAQGEPLPDSLRTPKYGAFLRRASLDELLGLFNVLKGEMSLVGPRPLLPEYIPYYSSRHARRHEVLPGITGLAQINGRQLAPFSERMEMDHWYVEHISLITDLRLLVLTVPKVLGFRGVVLGQDVREVDDLGLSREARERLTSA